MFSGTRRYLIATLSSRKRVQDTPILVTSRCVVGAAAVASAAAAVIYYGFIDDFAGETKHQFTSAEPNAKLNQPENEQQEVIQEYDFVIVGNGLAAKSAIRALERFCPHASIVVIDPFNNSMLQKLESSVSKTCYISQAVVQVDTSAKTVQFSSSSSSSSSQPQVHYKHSILLATGCRGAPPPLSNFDADAFSRVLELRSTILPAHCCTPASATNSSETSTPFGGELSFKRAALPPMTARALTITAVSQNANLTILGSGIEAIELAAAAAQKKKNGSIALVFGNAGPLASKVPRYLTTEITKRLKQFGIDVYNRHVVRYVSFAAAGQQLQQQQQKQQQGAVELHIARVSDSLDTKLLSIDLLVIAPPVDELRGSASLPFFSNSLSSLASRVFPIWSHMVTNGTVTCHSIDGRVMVNTELSAAKDVYSAGSVARYPNHMNGKSIICGGRGQSDSIQAGEIAATNMAAQYYYDRKGKISSTTLPPSTTPAAGASISSTMTTTYNHQFPILRTDMLSYASSSLPLQQQNQRICTISSFLHPSSALSSIGVHALFVGECNSEEMSTHGFWWTNKSTIKRDREQQQQGSSSSLNYIEDSSSDDDDNGDSSEIDGSQQGDSSSNKAIKLMMRATANLMNRQSCNTGSSKQPNYSLVRPVYGSGVVFFLDRTGKLVGVMTWGIPFTESSSAAPSDDLNDKLLSRIHRLLDTNGEVAKLSFSNMDNSCLSISDLAEESKRIMTIACSGNVITENIFRQDGTIAKPLHRFIPLSRNRIESSSASKTTARRKHESGETIEEDELYVRSSVYGGEMFRSRHSSLISSVAGSTTSQGNHSTTLGNGYYRPLNEDLLWMRHENGNRLLSAREANAQLFMQHMRQGRFADGTDPVEYLQKKPIRSSVYRRKTTAEVRTK